MIGWARSREIDHGVAGRRDGGVGSGGDSLVARR